MSWEHFIFARADRMKKTYSMACPVSIDRQQERHTHIMFLLSNSCVSNTSEVCFQMDCTQMCGTVLSLGTESEFVGW